MLICDLPREEAQHDDHEAEPCNARHHGAAEDLQIEEPAPEGVRGRGRDTGREGSKRTRTHGEVLGQVDRLVGAVPTEAHEDGDEEIHPLCLQEGPHLAELDEHGLPLRRVLELAPVAPDHFLGRREKERERQAETLEADEDEVCAVAYLPAFVLVHVQGELDGGADELAQFTETEPNPRL